MKIIADTNIWYGLGQESDLFERIKCEPIRPTFVNIHELSMSENVIDKVDLTRSAVRMLFHFKDSVIYEPPFIYLAKLQQSYDYDIIENVGIWLEFTSRFAQGETIDLSEKDNFRKETRSRKEVLIDASNFYNDEAKKIQERIKDKKAHKKKHTLAAIGSFLSKCVEISTKGKCNLDGLKMDKVELLIKTLGHFFKILETSKMKFQPNDWYDLAILAYVQSEDKYWTREKRWLNLIKEAGCENYLYEEKSV